MGKKKEKRERTKREISIINLTSYFFYFEIITIRSILKVVHYHSLEPCATSATEVRTKFERQE